MMNKNLHVRLRRLSSSVYVRHLWKAIEVVHNQRQLANYERIRRYMHREHDTTDDELTERLENSLHDGLLLLTKSVGNKGSLVGVEQEGYVLPKYCVRDSHDWYCFECHLEGEVIPCPSCHRVYHVACIATSSKNNSEFLCNLCNVNSGDLGSERLNRLLGYVFSHLSESLPSCATQWQENKSDSVLIEFLIYKRMDLSVIQRKILNGYYNNLNEFKADVRTILHNLIIFEGEQSSLAESVKTAVDSCLQDVKEIELCADCYQTSHEKNDRFWFCKPCRPPHELVYAQVKGYPFWPAKVIERINDQYDVRFFGGFHQRAVVDQDHIKAITDNVDGLQKPPKSVSWQKACQELKHHQMLLENGTVQYPKKYQRFLPKKRENNELVRQNQSTSKIRAKRKVHWRKKNVTTFTNEMKKSLNKKCRSIDSSSPCSLKNNVSVQTFCSFHKQHKYIMNLENTELKYLEENFNTEEMVNHVMQMYEQKKNSEKSVFQMNCDENHSFINMYCPLNKFRKNIFSNTEVENEMQEAMAEATDIINNKYAEIVDRMSQSHIRMLQEIKKKVWCNVCNEEASIHCCWNVDYCSQKCQNEHWETSHKQECLLGMLVESS